LLFLKPTFPAPDSLTGFPPPILSGAAGSFVLRHGPVFIFQCFLVFRRPYVFLLVGSLPERLLAGRHVFLQYGVSALGTHTNKGDYHLPPSKGLVSCSASQNHHQHIFSCKLFLSLSPFGRSTRPIFPPAAHFSFSVGVSPLDLLSGIPSSPFSYQQGVWLSVNLIKCLSPSQLRTFNNHHIVLFVGFLF